MEIREGTLVMISSKHAAGTISNHRYFFGIVTGMIGDQQKTLFSLHIFTPDGRNFTALQLIDRDLMIPIAQLSRQQIETINQENIGSVVMENICEIISSLMDNFKTHAHHLSERDGTDFPA
jgi:hypothetical protein